MKAFLFLILAACLAVSGRAQTTNNTTSQQFDDWQRQMQNQIEDALGKNGLPPGDQVTWDFDRYVHRRRMGGVRIIGSLPLMNGKSFSSSPKASPIRRCANHLNLSLHTVEPHRTHILQKLNLYSIPDLILYAVRKGIVA